MQASGQEYLVYENKTESKVGSHMQLGTTKNDQHKNHNIWTSFIKTGADSERVLGFQSNPF